MGSKRRQYTREFKLDAVRLVKESGKTATQVAADLGIDRSLLSSWKRDLDQVGQQAFPGSGKPGAELAEIRELKRRLAIAEEERDILKKALGYFAKERK
jgi:transposase